MLKKASSLALVALALAPAAALGQSAGDEQYADPLAGQDETAQNPSSNDSQATPSQDSTPSSGTQTQSQNDSSTAANSPQSGAKATALPRTGSTAPITAGAMGFVLLLAGTVVRRTARVQPGPLA